MIGALIYQVKIQFYLIALPTLVSYLTYLHEFAQRCYTYLCKIGWRLCHYIAKITAFLDCSLTPYFAF